MFYRSFTTGTCREGHTPQAQLNKVSPTNSRLSNEEIVEFLKGLVCEQTGIPIKNILASESLSSYGMDSFGVVRAAQKLSDFLGVLVGAVDMFTATCILDLANFSAKLVMKSHPQHLTSPSYVPGPETDSSEFGMEVSPSHKLGIWFFQILALIYISALLIIPAYPSVSAFISLLSTCSNLADGTSWLDYLISLAFAPLAWLLSIFSTCICIAYFGNSFLQPNYALTPEISVWSKDFVKWWGLYKAQETATKVLAVHLRGTVFLKYWFEMLAARIGSSVLLHTIDITDPSLVSIGDGAVIAEGALIQSYEVKNGILSFLPIIIGQNCSIGPYALIQKGSVLADGAEVQALQKIEGGMTGFHSNKANNGPKVRTLQFPFTSYIAS